MCVCVCATMHCIRTWVGPSQHCTNPSVTIPLHRNIRTVCISRRVSKKYNYSVFVRVYVCVCVCMFYVCPCFTTQTIHPFTPRTEAQTRNSEVYPIHASCSPTIRAFRPSCCSLHNRIQIWQWRVESRGVWLFKWMCCGNVEMLNDGGVASEQRASNINIWNWHTNGLTFGKRAYYYKSTIYLIDRITIYNL